ncbi:MAG: glycosyltransferase family 2 protein [Myxococcota bacterium]
MVTQLANRVIAAARAHVADATEPLGWFERERFPELPSDAEVLQDMQARRLLLPECAEPKVSIIVPVYGKFATTWNCLAALAEIDAGVSFEVIVVDDCSPDCTRQMLSRVDNVRMIENASNLGYLRSNNRAAESARGRWLCLLNNDTRVTPRWLAELVNTFEAFPRVGLVGSKLLFADGRLQEAGGIVFADASCENYGRWADPERPRYNFARSVDYCSAACVLLPRALWRDLGGFDEYFAPAYYEDTDLAFRVREAGFDVMYQPLSRVVHYHGVTHGKNPKHGLKRSLLVNRERFAQRWRPRLATHPSADDDVRASAERLQVPGLLLCLPRSPDSARDAELREYLDFARQVRHDGYHVSVACECGMMGKAVRSELGRNGIEICQESLPKLLRTRGQRFRAVMFVGAANAERARAIVQRNAPWLSCLQRPPSLREWQEIAPFGSKQRAE